uniref:Uncharacterized protein n=1 Tax=Picea sitchensis TaxID=3332 RepID=A9NQ06_PICSI|nr:unknown [Picea sitchensis]
MDGGRRRNPYQQVWGNARQWGSGQNENPREEISAHSGPSEHDAPYPRPHCLPLAMDLEGCINQGTEYEAPVPWG